MKTQLRLILQFVFSSPIIIIGVFFGYLFETFLVGFYYGKDLVDKFVKEIASSK